MQSLFSMQRTQCVRSFQACSPSTQFGARKAVTPQASLLGAAAVALAALPASVLVDEAIDRATNRVGRIANAVTPAGTRMYVARPPADTPVDSPAGRPAVVLIHQIFGLQDREARLADDLASRGYITLAPDTFGGVATTWIPRALALAYPRALAPGATWGVDAVTDAVAWLRQQPGVDPSRVAVAGFCYGGASALRYAVSHPDEVAAVGVFYGRPLATETGAAAYAPLAGCPVYGVFGGRDNQFPPPTVDAFEADLSAAGASAVIKRYPTQGHAFITDVEATRQPGSDAADAWGGFVEFLERSLQPSGIQK